MSDVSEEQFVVTRGEVERLQNIVANEVEKGFAWMMAENAHLRAQVAELTAEQQSLREELVDVWSQVDAAMSTLAFQSELRYGFLDDFPIYGYRYVNLPGCPPYTVRWTGGKRDFSYKADTFAKALRIATILRDEGLDAARKAVREETT